MAEEKKRTVKLFCPSLSKLVPVVAWEDQRLDLGSIARTFGIEPATLKLNGHFISRGVDLISSSVTWKSLLSFFSARGFSTGASDSDALIVDGKLSKLRSKRGACSPVDNEIQSLKGFSDNTNAHPESTKRIKDGTPGTFGCINQISPLNGLCLKRKFGLEGTSPVKKTRTNESNLDVTQRDRVFTTTRDRQLPCSFTSNEAKRMREEEMVVASPLKRLRN
nr:uncharacterized protein LOC109173457 [Ipomoea batatas]GMD18707.1 uncharacterized protein LOC109173457 [Ipomoea batatas]